MFMSPRTWRSENTRGITSHTALKEKKSKQGLTSEPKWWPESSQRVEYGWSENALTAGGWGQRKTDGGRTAGGWTKGNYSGLSLSKVRKSSCSLEDQEDMQANPFGGHLEKHPKGN